MERRRKPLRLPGYDYATPGAYFVTICANGRQNVFGEVINGEMRLDETGQIVSDVWRALPDRYPFIECDQFIVMPNHVHGIIWLTNLRRGESCIRPIRGGESCIRPIRGSDDEHRPYVNPKGTLPGTVNRVVQGFKSLTTIGWMRQNHGSTQTKIWQRGYYERVIRNGRELDAMRSYIANNAQKWNMDPEHPPS